MSENSNDILTSEEVNLIRHALKKVYKDHLFNTVESKAKEIENKHPLGTHGSIVAYCRGDGVEVEDATVEEMQRSTDKKIVALGNQISDLMLSSGISVMHSGDKSSNSPIIGKIIELEDASPMAPAFKVARKLQQFGRDSR